MNYGYGDTSQYSQGQIYEIQLQGRNLDRKDVTGKSDPFFVLKAATHPGLMTGTTSMTSASYNLNPLKKKKDKSFKKVHKIEKKLDKKGGGWVVVHRSETIMSNLNPTYAIFAFFAQIFISYLFADGAPSQLILLNYVIIISINHLSLRFSIGTVMVRMILSVLLG